MGLRRVKNRVAGYEVIHGHSQLPDPNIVLLRKDTPDLAGDAAALVERVDEDACNPLACWHRMGEPADLTEEQLAFLRAASQPARETQPVQDGQLRLTLGKNAVVRLRVLPVERCAENGYDYDYYNQ